MPYKSKKQQAAYKATDGWKKPVKGGKGKMKTRTGKTRK